MSLPSSPSGSSSTESTSTSGTNSSTDTSSESSSQLSSRSSSPERTTTSASSSHSTSPELQEMEHSFNTLLVGTREIQGHAVMRSQMGNLREREQQQRIAILKQVAMQLQNQLRPVSVPPTANVPLPPYPQRCPSDMGSRSQVQAENANALRKNSSDSETDRLQDIEEKPCRHIGSSHVKELAKFFTPTSDEDNHSHVNTRTRCKKLFEPKEKEGKKE